MKKLLVLVWLVVVGVNAQPVQKTPNAIYMTNDFNVTKIKIIDNATNTLPWLEFGSQTRSVFTLPVTGIVPLANLGFQTGTNVTGSSGLATNTFSPVYSSAPRVFLTPMTHTVTNYVVSVTTSNVITKSDPSVTNQILAVPTL